MDEGYSAAAMVSLVAASLRRRGLPLPFEASVLDGGGGVAGRDGTRVSLSAKRRLLAAVAEAYGEGELVLAGQAAIGGPFDALGHALASAPTPGECLARWRRLERYVHSRHRTIITTQTAEPTGSAETARTTDGVVVHHTAPAGPPPVRHESLLVAGVLAGLLSAQGCTTVRLSLAHKAMPPVTTTLLDGGRLVAPRVPPGPVDRFRLTWTQGAPRQTPTEPEPPPAGRGTVTEAVLRRILTDPTRRWTLGELAAATGTSARTLQRRLREEGGSFSTTIATARVMRASALLADAAVPLSTVGFLAGYADGPHFSREFARRSGTSPGRYRTVITHAEIDHEPAL
ncbi:helix-turn-helix domain-containing protein [Nonomuraea sp. NN258]|uniref:helix-turn-helix transcriptional regulator n=1 Tax=Nonomuraea antri TaxID=2730852 RepID=UPI00156A4F66|nr:helix-turn-helix transcriptional regulator [Nonomuraea antri]NRQ33754.1 helix-turn-helix domain-containing protein [Nonomuraea antri]